MLEPSLVIISYGTFWKQWGVYMFYNSQSTLNSIDFSGNRFECLVMTTHSVYQCPLQDLFNMPFSSHILNA